MISIKSNENEFRGHVIAWLEEFLSGSYPFESATADPSLKVSDKKTRFPDVFLWLNREAHQGFCVWELKTPATPIDDPELLKNAVEKSRAIHAEYFITWNMREAMIWKVPPLGEQVTNRNRYHSYPPLYQINSPDDALVESNRILLKDQARKFLDDLADIRRIGHLPKFEMDATFFVNRLHDAVKKISNNVKDALKTKYGSDRKFKKSLSEWAAKQGILRFDDEPFYESVSNQIVYRLLARILLYYTIRRRWSKLPPLNIYQLSPEQAQKEINKVFAQARQIDWHAVFEQDLIDDVPLPKLAIEEIDALLRELDQYNFSDMPQDIVGAVFEKLILPEERHKLGQYFTQENLVDLINAFCIHTIDDYVLDPTCGTGTFLTRAYDRLKYLGLREHGKLLSHLWGIDIAPFPAELATINLFRQDISDNANYPRIQRKDFFEVKIGGEPFEFPPPTAGDAVELEKMKETIPLFDGAVGNFPYIRQELIKKHIIFLLLATDL